MLAWCVVEFRIESSSGHQVAPEVFISELFQRASAHNELGLGYENKRNGGYRHLRASTIASAPVVLHVQTQGGPEVRGGSNCWTMNTIPSVSTAYQEVPAHLFNEHWSILVQPAQKRTKLTKGASSVPRSKCWRNSSMINRILVQVGHAFSLKFSCTFGPAYSGENFPGQQSGCWQGLDCSKGGLSSSSCPGGGREGKSSPTMSARRMSDFQSHGQRKQERRQQVRPSSAGCFIRGLLRSAFCSP